MSTYPEDSGPSCGMPTCTLSLCQGPDSHSKKPWYLSQNPVMNPNMIGPTPVELMKIDGWVLEKNSESDIDSTLFHYCPSTQWKKQLMIPEIRAGLCDDCCELMPKEIVAAFTMHNWTMLQKYDSDMKKYGNDPYHPITTETKIEVFR